MKIVCLSDTHSFHQGLTPPKGDVLVHAGDVSNSGMLHEINRFAEWFRRQPHAYKILVPGNHDGLFEKDWNVARSCFSNDVQILHDQEVTIQGRRFYGSAWQPEFCNWAFNLPRGAALREVWNKIPENTEVLITHCPPQGIGDKTFRGEEVGCEELRKAVEKIRPRLHIFGHIHEARGVYHVDGLPTTFVNASIKIEFPPFQTLEV